MKKLMIAAILISSYTTAIASEFETMKADLKLNAISAEALQRIELGEIPAPELERAGQSVQPLFLDDSRKADFEMMDVVTMEKLYEGYLILEGRGIYTGGDENADLLMKLKGNSFRAEGVLMTVLKKKFPFQTVYVYLTTSPGQTPSSVVFLQSKRFFREKSAKKYQKSLATEAAVTVSFTVYYNYREIIESPFKIKSIEMPWDRK
ncbi:MAG: hypothetical protein KAR84_02250 [Elusimicrobiales bacterium]|nr:hypothetical protein [Elusimicrobiales bacterium]